MMTIRWLLCVIALLLAAQPAAAQVDGWTAWLFDGETGQMTRVSAGGELDSFRLPLPTGFDRYPMRVAVGHGGSPFAYVVFNSMTYQGQLVFSQREAFQAGFSLPLTLATSLEFETGETVFSADNTALALGYSLDGGGWAVLVVDTRTGSVTATLRHDTTLAALGIPAGYGLTPIVRRFVGRDVTFSLVQSGTEMAAYYDSYTWNLDTNRLTAHPGFPGLDADTLLLTGETVMTLYDDRLPNESDAFIFFQANTLHIFDPATGARFPFYNAPGESLFAPRFIQGGERVLVGAAGPADFAPQWRVLERDGRTVGALPSAVVINSTAGVPDGFIYLTDAFSPGAMTLVYVDTRAGINAGVPVWTGAPGAQPVIVWAGGGSPAAAAAVVPWAQLAEPVYANREAFSAAPTAFAPMSPGDVPAVTPVISGFLAVGGTAIVNTTQGDNLNVRLGPGTGFDIAGRLPNGARVVLLEGPRFAEGYTWWKIRAVSGLEGWAVESVDDGGTRLQTLLPG